MSIKRRIYEIIESSKDGDVVSKIYDTMILVSITVGMFPLMMKTGNVYTKWINLVTSFIFLFDYLWRVFTSDYKMGFKSYKSYIAYIFMPMAIIDLLSVIPILAIFFPKLGLMSVFRLFRVARVLKLLRYSKTMVIIVNVARKAKSQLVAVLMLTLAYIFTCALIIFQIEPDLFPNFFDAIYWATISITTVGYGDISPVTSVGRMMTIVSSLVGVAIIALPSGIITAAYMDEVNKKKTGHQL